MPLCFFFLALKLLMLLFLLFSLHVLKELCSYCKRKRNKLNKMEFLLSFWTRAQERVLILFEGFICWAHLERFSLLLDNNLLWYTTLFSAFVTIQFFGHFKFLFYFVLPTIYLWKWLIDIWDVLFSFRLKCD